MNKEHFNLTNKVTTRYHYEFFLEDFELQLMLPDGRQKVLSNVEDDILGLALLNKNLVCALTSNNDIKFWDAKARYINSFTEHNDEIIFFQKFENNLLDEKECLISISKKDKLVIFDNESKVRMSINFDLAIPKNFRCFNQTISLLKKNKGLLYYQWDDEKEYYTFAGLNEGVSEIREFKNGICATNSYLNTSDTNRWDTKSKTKFGISLWTSDGNILDKKIESHYDLKSCSDIHDFSKDMIIMGSNDDSLHLLDAHGKEVLKYQLISKTTKPLLKIKDKYKDKAKLFSVKQSFEKGISTFTEIEYTKNHKNNILDYEHYSNGFIKTRFIPNDRIRKYNKSNKITQNDISSQPKKNKLWDFFNRPRRNNIYQALIKEERKLNNAIENLKKHIRFSNLQIEAINNFIKKSLFLSYLLGILAAIGMIVAYFDIKIFPQQLEKTDKPIAILLTVIFVISYLKGLFNKVKNKSIKKSIIQNNEVVTKIIEFLLSKVTEIKDYRNSIIKQIPDLNGLDNIVNNTINAIIPLEQKNTNLIDIGSSQLKLDTIESIGLQACGISKDEIDTPDRKPIVLNDMAFIQKQDDYTQNKIKRQGSKHQFNQFSFFATNRFGYLCAIQYIQMIFLTKEKLDLFTTFYDFIEKKFISQQSYSFYYKDITNFSRKDVSNKIDLQSNDINEIKANAVELTLSVASGESISILIRDEDTMNNLSQDLKNIEKQHDPENEEIIYLKEKENKTDADKKRLEQLQTQSDTNSTESIQQRTKEGENINKKINAIRTKINEFKKLNENT